MAVHIVAVGVEADLAASAAVGVQHRCEQEDHLVAQLARDRIIGRDEIQRALSMTYDVAGFPGMLAGLQPDRSLALIGPLEVRDRDQVQVSPAHRLADGLYPCRRTLADQVEAVEQPAVV